MKPGIHFDVPMEEYLAIDAVSASALCQLDRSPAHYRVYTNGAREESAALTLGDAIHSAALEPHLFGQRFLAGPNGPWNKNPWAAEVKALREANPQRTVLKPDDYATAIYVRDRLLSRPDYRAVVEGARVEVTMLWVDEATGLLCKARADLLNAPYMGDIKSTVDATRSGFPRQAEKFGYHMKAAHYTNGADVLGLDVRTFRIFAIEKNAPNGTNTLDYTVGASGVLDYAKTRVRALLDKLAVCKALNHWPLESDEYASDPIEMTRPDWAWETEEEVAAW